MAARNRTFHPSHEPLRDNDALQLNTSKIHGPFSFLNPTQAHFNHVGRPKSSADSEDAPKGDDNPVKELETGEDTVPASAVSYKWTSRNNRKGRHALTITPATDGNAQYEVPAPTSTPREIVKGISRCFTKYPVWDVSWLVAYVFTWGSIIWIINAFFSLLPYTNPGLDFKNEVLYGGGITAFIGATVGLNSLRGHCIISCSVLVW